MTVHKADLFQYIWNFAKNRYLGLGFFSKTVFN